MDHQLENAVPHQAVVQRSRTTSPLKARPRLWRETSVSQIFCYCFQYPVNVLNASTPLKPFLIQEYWAKCGKTLFCRLFHFYIRGKIILGTNPQHFNYKKKDSCHCNVCPWAYDVLPPSITLPVGIWFPNPLLHKKTLSRTCKRV